VPLRGESVIQQQNSSNAILTLMHSTANTGRFLMGMDHAMDTSATHLVSSNLTDLVVCDIDADGGFRAVSGTTILMELDSSGLYVGSTQIMELENGKLVSGGYRETTVISSGTTAVAITSADSGKLYMISTNAAGGDTVMVTLTSTPRVGDNFEIYMDSSAASQVKVKTGAGGDSQGFFVFQSSNDFLSTASVNCGTSGTFHWRFTALTSGSLWAVAGLSYYDGTTTIYGAPIAGTTTT